MAARNYHRNEFIFKTISALRIVVGVAVTLAVLFAMVWLIDYSSDRPASSYNQQTVLLPDQSNDEKSQQAGTFFEGLLNKKQKKDEQDVTVLQKKPYRNSNTAEQQRSSGVKKAQGPPGKSRPALQPVVTQSQSSQSKVLPSLPSSAANGVFAVQLGSFQQVERARIFSESLAAKGYQPYILNSATPDGTLIYRVRVGRFATREEAMSLAVRIEGTEKISVFVTAQ